MLQLQQQRTSFVIIILSFIVITVQPRWEHWNVFVLKVNSVYIDLIGKQVRVFLGRCVWWLLPWWGVIFGSLTLALICVLALGTIMPVVYVYQKVWTIFSFSIKASKIDRFVLTYLGRICDENENADCCCCLLGSFFVPVNIPRHSLNVLPYINFNQSGWLYITIIILGKAILLQYSYWCQTSKF